MEDKTNWAEILLIVVLITLWGPFNDQGLWDKLDFGLCIEFSTDNLINISNTMYKCANTRGTFKAGSYMKTGR